MPVSRRAMSGSGCCRGRCCMPVAVAMAFLLAFVTTQQPRCQALPANMIFGGGPLITDPDFPDYWQLPETYIDDDDVVASPDDLSLGAVGSPTEIHGPPLTTLPRVTSTRPAGRRGCRPQREKYLLKLLATSIPRLQRFTPSALCPSVRRHTTATTRTATESRGGGGGATSTTQRDAVGRFNMPTSCSPRQLGHNTQCPYKVRCEYNATRYPPLVYKVTCLQRKGYGAFTMARRRGYVTNMPLGCPLQRECGVMRERVPVLRLLDPSRCNAQGREEWTVSHEWLPYGCACPSALYRR